jgi:hypothetical protein
MAAKSTTTATPTTARRRLPRRLMLVAGIVVALCLGGGAIAVYFGIANPSVPAGPPTAAARSFLNDLQTQSYHDAYTFLCQTVQSSLTEDDFVTELRAGRTLQSYTVTGTDTSKVDNIPSAKVSVTVTRAGGSQSDETVLMREDGDIWQVCGGTIMPNSGTS